MSNQVIYMSIFILVAGTSAWGQQSPRTNPQIGANVLMLGQSGNKGTQETDENPNGFRLQEAELRFSSNVDAYFRGDMLLAVEKEDGEYKINPEEVYVETLNVPEVTLKIGQFFQTVGRHNSLHTHAFPFIDAPLANQRLLGDEGLNQAGLSAAYLAPTPWFLEVTAEAFEADNESLYGSDTQGDLATHLSLKNLWEINDPSTLEFILGFGSGANAFDHQSRLWSTSMTYKFKPLEASRAKSLIVTAEYLRAERSGASTDEDVGGVAAWVQWQVLRRWWVQARDEYLGLPEPTAGAVKKHSALVGFAPTEFSGLRLQYDNIDDPAQDKTENRVSFQINVSLGAHPAHSY